jgi:hypothetical protein
VSTRRWGFGDGPRLETGGDGLAPRPPGRPEPAMHPSRDMDAPVFSAAGLIDPRDHWIAAVRSVNRQNARQFVRS